jgi:hypothetical protein
VKHSSCTRTPLALVVLALLGALAGACSSKLDDKECAKLRGDAFELLNKGQQCNTDQDCRQSDWPGCAKPISNANWDKIKPWADTYKKGQCDEPKIECKEPPPSYCKQGLCVHREVGTPEGAKDTPIDQIEIK